MSENQQSFWSEQIPPKDWETTPESIKQLVKSLLASTPTTERESHFKKVEQQICNNALKRESRYRQMIQAQTDLVLRSRPDTTIIFANAAVCRALGQSLEEVIGQQWRNFVPPEDLEQLNRKLAALSPTAPTFENINRDYRANQQIGWTQWINIGIFDDQGNLVEIQSVGRDVTKLQQQILREQALNRVFQAIRNSLDLTVIFATATAETAQLLAPLNCLVVRYLPTEGLWRTVAEFHHDPGVESVLGMDIPDGGNPLAEQLKAGQIVQVRDTATFTDPINQEVAQVTPGAWLMIPLMVEGELWGSFNLCTEQRPFSWLSEQVELAQAVAQQLEVAIQQANLYQQVQQELAERQRIATALQESETRFQNMAANVPGAIFRYLLRPDGTDGVLYMSLGCSQLWEVQAQQVVDDATVLWQMVLPEDLPGMQASVLESAQTLEPWHHVWRIITPSGRKKWLEAAGRPAAQANGDIIWDTLILDVSERRQAEAALRDSEARYRLLAENMNDLVCLHSPTGQYLYISPSCEALLGYGYQEMLGRDYLEFIHPEDRDRVSQETLAVTRERKTAPLTYRMRTKSGNYIWFETLIKPIVDDSGHISQLQTTSRDVTERVRVQNQLKYDALHDALTGLPNRQLLMERLELALNRTRRLGTYQFAVVFFDLDRFKVINDSLGHLAGDQLLITVARKLTTMLREIDLATRLGGDEFVILLEEISEVQEVVRVVERILSQLHTPVTLEGREVYTTASAGIVMGSSHYEQAAHLLRDADIAMYRAKVKGKARYEIFNTAMHIQAVHHLTVEHDLRRAVENQEFVLHYQPIVDLESLQLAGFEALIRWQHPTEGLKTPGSFIAIAEETGMITALDFWGLRCACQQLVTWQAAFPKLPTIKVSVNLSAQDLHHRQLLPEIEQILRDTQLKGAYLTLEITESMLIEDVEATIALLSQLKTWGIQISIDDFGTGYSSLSYLHRLPLDYLKVDRAFVQQIQRDRRHRQIVDTIATLSQQLELSAIAEGIETQAQLEHLRQLGYQFGQGYFFSRPLTPEAATTLLGKNENAWL